MKAKVLNLLLGFSFLISFSVFAQENTSIEEAQNLSHKIVMDVSRGRFEDAWRIVKSSSTIPSDRIDLFAKEYDSHYVRTILKFGPTTGVELISQDMLGKSMLRITYLVKYEVTGVAWFMYFYRVGDKWVLSEFNYDINSSSLFKTAATAPSSTMNDLVLGEWQHKIERRIKALERTPGGSTASVDLSDVALKAPELAILNLIERRLLEIEDLYRDSKAKMGSIEEDNEEILRRLEETDVYALEQEVARLRRMVLALRTQHPYADLPRY